MCSDFTSPKIINTQRVDKAKLSLEENEVDLEHRRYGGITSFRNELPGMK